MLLSFNFKAQGARLVEASLEDHAGLLAAVGTFLTDLPHAPRFSTPPPRQLSPTAAAAHRPAPIAWPTPMPPWLRSSTRPRPAHIPPPTVDPRLAVHSTPDLRLRPLPGHPYSRRSQPRLRPPDSAPPPGVLCHSARPPRAVAAATGAHGRCKPYCDSDNKVCEFIGSWHSLSLHELPIHADEQATVETEVQQVEIAEQELIEGEEQVVEEEPPNTEEFDLI
uniref:Uncharacterized protein n=1 Tax=Zea mays TaxID=4577 RepID=A0A804QBW2_MAIZE